MTEIELSLPESSTKHRKPRKKRSTVNSELNNVHESNEDILKQYKNFVNAPKFNLNSEEVYCICREPDEGDIMVACDGCEEWFHMKCMNVNPDVSNLIAKFYCKFCKWKNIGSTLWKRKCRLEECLKPIADNSKYCSKEHGEEYMRRLFHEKNVDIETIKKVLGFVGDSEKLHQLGSRFPELEQINKFKTDESIDQFPMNTQEELTNLKNQSDSTNDQIHALEKKLENLQSMKENIKFINEKVSESIYPGENQKKKKQKKLELCMCDKSDNNMIIQIGSSNELLEKLIKKISKRMETIEEDEVEEEQNEDEDGDTNMETVQDYDDPDWFYEVCVKEKKKCHRHAGWFSLYYDEIIKVLDQLVSKKEQLKTEEDNVLRNYSITVYESQ
ncbi:SPP1 [Candida jiufengensis]|uniref:SPP1 n=1 Tax=Candida jiufengensis TaxID=497108 RepID=UPI00222497DC|nr:SPP1 [Candida jiufengensis]KAI5955823.1 SPP1 [Candida jiufengensis]